MAEGVTTARFLVDEMGLSDTVTARTAVCCSAALTSLLISTTVNAVSSSEGLEHRQRDRHTDRQTDRQTHRHTDQTDARTHARTHSHTHTHSLSLSLFVP